MRKIMVIVMVMVLMLLSTSIQSQTQSLEGTTIIVAGARDTIWIAADRKVIDKQRGTTSEKVKIEEFGRYCVVMSGHSMVTVGDRVFDPTATIASFIKQSPLSDSAYGDISFKIKNELEGIIREAIIGKSFIYPLSIDSPLLAFAIASVISEPFSYVCEYNLYFESAHKWEVKMRPIVQHRIFVGMLGEVQAIDSGGIVGWLKGGASDLLGILFDQIKEQIKATPEKVGLPMDGVIITKRGVVWRRNVN